MRGSGRGSRGSHPRADHGEDRMDWACPGRGEVNRGMQRNTCQGQAAEEVSHAMLRLRPRVATGVREGLSASL